VGACACVSEHTSTSVVHDECFDARFLHTAALQSPQRISMITERHKHEMSELKARHAEEVEALEAGHNTELKAARKHNQNILARRKY
jgi:hypothetical protein